MADSYHHGNLRQALIDAGIKIINENGIEQTEKMQEIEIIKTWALVHGMASIACMKGIHSTINWDDPISDF